MKIFYFSLSFLMILLTSSVKAQVGIGTSTPDSTAALDVSSTTAGFLPPRLTTTQRNAILKPAKGLTIFNTTVKCLQWHTDTGFWYDPCLGTFTGTSSYSSLTSIVGCRTGAGTNGSPSGVRQGGVNQTMVQGVNATDSATVSLRANVTTIGTYYISTNTVNGVSFIGSGTFTATGTQSITLKAIGTPAAAGNFVWAVIGSPSIFIYGSVLTKTAPLGSSYTSHYNGIVSGVHNTTDPADPTYFTLSTYTVGETFDNNDSCKNKPISAQGCSSVSSVTIGSNTYNTVAINGQCWLQTNLKQAPSVYSNYSTTSWTNTTQNDQGYWGFYNASDTTGVSGWGDTVPAANHGFLYQWCGAMDATISERSQGICPAGWHIPSDCEWMFLEHGQGLSLAFQIANSGSRGSSSDNQGTIGYKLRSEGTGQTNASGFSALLTGNRSILGWYNNLNFQPGTHFWTSNATTAAEAHRRLLQTAATPRSVVRNAINTAFGNSVRCLKD